MPTGSDMETSSRYADSKQLFVRRTLSGRPDAVMPGLVLTCSGHLRDRRGRFGAWMARTGPAMTKAGMLLCEERAQMP